MDDQVDGLNAAFDRFPQLDRQRVGVYGWSYGGYMAVQLLAKYSNLYKCSCAGGTVFDWTFYDTCYTESNFFFNWIYKIYLFIFCFLGYMGLPKDNPNEYNASNLLHLLPNLPNE